MPDQTKQRHLKIQSSPLEKGENSLIVTLPYFSLLFSIHASMVCHTVTPLLRNNLLSPRLLALSPQIPLACWPVQLFCSSPQPQALISISIPQGISFSSHFWLLSFFLYDWSYWTKYKICVCEYVNLWICDTLCQQSNLCLFDFVFLCLLLLYSLFLTQDRKSVV